MAASAIEAKLDALIALMTAQAQAAATTPQIQTAPAVPQTPSSDPVKPVKATAKNKADREAVPANEVSGTIKRIAKSGTGLVLAETDQWYNLISDGNPIFKGLTVGTRIRLERNKLGRVVMAHLQTPETEAAPKGAATAPQTPKPQTPQTPKTVTPPPATPAVPTGCKVAKDGTVRLPCAYCLGEAHNKYSADQVARECAIRQYLRANPTAEMPTTANLAAEIAYLTWRSTRTLIVFAFNKDGRETLGLAPTSTAMAASVASATVAPTVSTPKPEAAKAASPKPVGSAIGRTVRRTAQTASTPPTPPAAAASVSSSTVTPDSASLVVAPTPTAPATTATVSTATPSKYEANVVYKGYLVRHAGKPIGMIKFLTASFPGPKGDGNWFYSSEKVRGEIVKYNEGDRIAVVLGYIKNTSGVMELGIVKHKLLGSVEKETGAVAGVKTSGKQQPAETRKPLVDRRVKAATPEQKAKLARESRGAARRESQAGRSSKSGFLTTLISALIV